MISELNKSGAHASVVKFMHEHHVVVAGNQLTVEWFNVDTAFRFVLNTTLNLKEVLEKLDAAAKAAAKVGGCDPGQSLDVLMTYFCIEDLKQLVHLGGRWCCESEMEAEFEPNMDFDE